MDFPRVRGEKAAVRRAQKQPTGFVDAFHTAFRYDETVTVKQGNAASRKSGALVVFGAKAGKSLVKPPFVCLIELAQNAYRQPVKRSAEPKLLQIYRNVFSESSRFAGISRPEYVHANANAHSTCMNLEGNPAKLPERSSRRPCNDKIVRPLHQDNSQIVRVISRSRQRRNQRTAHGKCGNQAQRWQLSRQNIRTQENRQVQAAFRARPRAPLPPVPARLPPCAHRVSFGLPRLDCPLDQIVRRRNLVVVGYAKHGRVARVARLCRRVRTRAWSSPQSRRPARGWAKVPAAASPRSRARIRAGAAA